MVQYSRDILNEFGAPELSDLTTCGAAELPDLPNYLGAAIGGHIAGTKYPDASVRHLDLALLRRSNAAAEEYKAGRRFLLGYIEGINRGEHQLQAFLSALTHFEQCLNWVWQAAELFGRTEKQVLQVASTSPTLFRFGDGTDLERINKLNGVAKHFSASQAERTSTPIWITNVGLKCEGAVLTFDELRENIVALFEVARQLFVEIPAEAVARAKQR